MSDQILPYPENFDFGYDPSRTEPVEFTVLPKLDSLPAAYSINSAYLPPIGSQGQCPSCAAWAGVYGLVTFWAASNGGGSPSDTTNQASPSFIYIKVMQKNTGPDSNDCAGSSIMEYFPILQADGGTPSMANAPYTDGSPMGSGECGYLWQSYENNTPAIDNAFNIPAYNVVNTKKTGDVKQVLSQGNAIAYGTSLYTDFIGYKGDPNPYVGNGKILKNSKTGKPAGHCMLIIGYNDNLNNNGTGAFLIQNSWSTDFGINGTIWMAYDTFTKLAQGQGFYIPAQS